LKVTPESWNKAVVMARKLENTIFKLLDTGMNATGYALQKMENRIRQAGKGGISQSDLTRAFQSEPLQERERQLKTLLDAGTVIRTFMDTPGRRATVYTHQDHADCTEEVRAPA
jgi:hypothetical protein